MTFPQLKPQQDINREARRRREIETLKDIFGGAVMFAVFYAFLVVLFAVT